MTDDATSSIAWVNAAEGAWLAAVTGLRPDGFLAEQPPPGEPPPPAAGNAAATDAGPDRLSNLPMELFLITAHQLSPVELLRHHVVTATT